MDVENAKRIVRILRFFFLALDLEINLLKIKLICFGVPMPEVEVTTLVIWCEVLSLPFMHLGVVVR